MKTTVVNVRKNNLIESGYKNFSDWASNPDHVYIGRDIRFYVAGTTQSKWANPFSVRVYGREKCLELYKNYIMSNEMLLSCIDELDGKELGCWCAPNKCHGDILIEILQNKKIDKYTV